MLTYTHPIRELDLWNGDSYDVSPLLNDIHRIWLLAYTFPNFHTLECNCPYQAFDDALVFMDDGIRKFRISISNPHYRNIDSSKSIDLTDIIQLRMPKLTSLSINVPLRHREELLMPLATLLAHLPSLEDVWIPSFEDIQASVLLQNCEGCGSSSTTGSP
ncbi:hypothetical protein D9758_007377 [Tetrapyrgos nigripes]|uniref:Uncharacterized protein n=1 Tax=Tetrapyrgos nigripes TaxID=182062 RepID=A0A8H5GAY2_9AGAR|nr:hypothetical protein D9758_007377 [Tetrapyrgos nigripes]